MNKCCIFSTTCILIASLGTLFAKRGHETTCRPHLFGGHLHYPGTILLGICPDTGLMIRPNRVDSGHGHSISGHQSGR